VRYPSWGELGASGAEFAGASTDVPVDDPQAWHQCIVTSGAPQDHDRSDVHHNARIDSTIVNCDPKLTFLEFEEERSQRQQMQYPLFPDSLSNTMGMNGEWWP
jgi:hypothetical protein